MPMYNDKVYVINVVTIFSKHKQGYVKLKYFVSSINVFFQHPYFVNHSMKSTISTCFVQEILVFPFPKVSLLNH